MASQESDAWDALQKAVYESTDLKTDAEYSKKEYVDKKISKNWQTRIMAVYSFTKFINDRMISVKWSF